MRPLGRSGSQAAGAGGGDRDVRAVGEDATDSQVEERGGAGGGVGVEDVHAGHLTQWGPSPPLGLAGSAGEGVGHVGEGGLEEVPRSR